MKIYDITKPLDNSTKSFPSEPKTVIKKVCEIYSHCPVNVSEIIISSHAGTHCDAPSHYYKNGNSIDQLDLSLFIGECSVIDVSHIRSSIKYKDVQNFLLEKITLFKVHECEKSYAYSSECCIKYLGSNGVKVIGINAMSIDEYSSKGMKANFPYLKYDIQIIEGLDLSNVRSGKYKFIGLPLKIIGVDASPIRAVLIEGGEDVI